MSDKASSHSEVSDSEEEVEEIDEEEQKRRKHPENYNKRNKLALGKFHRYAIEKPKKRAVPNKKKIRDLERLLEKKGDSMPEEVKLAKQKELKALKKGEKSKKEAEKFESRYKKIRFFEKKKIIRKLEQLEKEGAGKDEEKVKYRNYLTYVNNFPNTKKYISLFPTEETEKSQQERDTMMQKIIKIAEVKNKIREKELIEMDKEFEEAGLDEERVEKKVKQIQQNDAFFTVEEGVQPAAKKIVKRNGFVEEMPEEKKKPWQRPQSREQGTRQQRDYTKQAAPVPKKESQPLKINPNSYRVRGSQIAEVPARTHIKF